MSADGMAQARERDEEAFHQLAANYGKELEVHCYRLLGSVQDAEDVLQETLLAAWQGLAGFEGRASLRTWLYRIATNRCLNLLRTRRRRPSAAGQALRLELPQSSRTSEVFWLNPYPDTRLDGLVDTSPGPEVQYEAREAISLAFVTALQLLPPRQRAALILRDVLGFRAAEVAQILESSEESVTSALKRARGTLQSKLRDSAGIAAPTPGSPAECELVERFTRAFQAQDVHAVVALLAEDVRLEMPPLLLKYEGREEVTRFLHAIFLRQGPPPRLVRTRANGQPAFGHYVRGDPGAPVRTATVLLVLSLAGDRISAITGFDVRVLDHFGLPEMVDDDGEL